MSVRGQRFELNLEEDEDDRQPRTSPFDFVNDVKERATSAPRPPAPPAPRNSQSGFPSHRKRVAQSKFKKSRHTSRDDDESGQQDVLQDRGNAQPGPAKDPSESFVEAERRRIDEENTQTLAAMSPEEIERERQELLQSLDSSLIQRLLARATFDRGDSNEDFPGLSRPDPEAPQSSSTTLKSPKPRKSVTFAEAENETGDHVAHDAHEHGHAIAMEAEGQPKSEPLHGTDADYIDSLPADSSIHFPHAPQPPQLDPSSSSFLTDLHEKYFPSLPADPSKLEWMSSTSGESSYSASSSGLDPKDIRFSFTGRLIPPKLAAEIPVTAGLHHHGDAPDAAGYTIPELAMLARSSVAAQRCIAFQTLGRILYRLGQGEFGNPGDGGAGTVGAEDTLGELARGLWSEVEKEGVVEICVAESDGRGVGGGRHVSAKAYATEAVWLWRKGGGRRWKAA